MIKVIVAIPKRPDLSDEAFHAHWIEPHGRLALNIRAMRRYVQSHRIHHPSLAPYAGPYEGFAEVWLDDLRTALGLGQDPDYRQHLVPDEPNFCDVPGLRFLIAEEEVILAGPPLERDARLFKVIQLFKGGFGAHESPADFGDPTDAAVVERLAPLRYVRCHARAPGSFDGARELWWTNSAAFEEARARAPEAWRALARDSEGIRHRSQIDAVEELQLLW